MGAVSAQKAVQGLRRRQGTRGTEENSDSHEVFFTYLEILPRLLRGNMIADFVLVATNFGSSLFHNSTLNSILPLQPLTRVCFSVLSRRICAAVATS